MVALGFVACIFEIFINSKSMVDLWFSIKLECVHESWRELGKGPVDTLGFALGRGGGIT
mgnify:CR=1 FL=1